MAARIAGKSGSVYIGGVKIADINNWEMDLEVEVAACAIKGEKHETYAVGRTATKVRAERYIQNLTTPSVLTTMARTAGLSGGNATGGTTITFELDGIDGGASGPIITGEGFISKGSVRCPRGMMQDNIEITCIAMPTVA